MNIFPSMSLIFFPLILAIHASSKKLGCYQCNTDLSSGHTADCNDPYAPGPSIDFVVCPENEPHVCLKAFIFHKNIHATVRACVPSRSRSTYCAFQDLYPEAQVSCNFCSVNACNQSSPGSRLLLITKLIIIALIIFILTVNSYFV